MTAETARKFEALESQAQALMGVFIKGGYEAVAPAMIQPAGVYLDVIGEALRARTYVFADPDGEELCLRPDLTVPACRLYLERHPEANVAARYCYNGPAFRFQPEGAGSAHPREFRQAGIERFGESEPAAADVEVMGLIAEAVRTAGLTDFSLRIGDPGLFSALLASLDIRDRFRARLRHAFLRPDSFRAELARLVEGPASVLSGLPAGLMARIDVDDQEASEEIVAAHLAQAGIALLGTRTLGEITEGLIATAVDAKARPMPKEAAERIESYLSVVAPASQVADRLACLLGGQGAGLEAALAAFRQRLALIEAAGFDVSRVTFSSEFGRSLEYYTGFVFELTVPKLGWASPIAGGGRYDRLLQDVGAARAVPAVGAAIHTERLLAAVQGGEA